MTSSLDYAGRQKELAELADEAVRDGQVLFNWLQNAKVDAIAFPLNLKKSYQLKNTATGYFGELEIGGKPTTVMGARQKIDFGEMPGITKQDLLDFMFAEFLPRANWTYPDSNPGGFTITQSLYKKIDGTVGIFDEKLRKGCIDWRLLGKEYEWVLLTVDLHDFVMDIGPFKKRLKEAACVTPNAKFSYVKDTPTGVEIMIGYPFVRIAPVKHFFGFGPGKFGVAIKLFTMKLDGTKVSGSMDFAAAPRAQKVFDFGGLPDPIYGTASFLEKITFGLFKSQKIRQKMDTQMLGQHCRVHQALMEGIAPIWRKWQADRHPAAS
jgi:hypothetical protein